MSETITQIPANDAASPEQIRQYAQEARTALEALKEGATDADRAVIKNLVHEIMIIYAREGREAADKRLATETGNLRVLKEVNDTMNSTFSDDKKPFDLSRIGDNIAKLNLAQAHLIAGIGQNIPGFRTASGLLSKLAHLEGTITGLTGKPQIFKALGEAVNKLDDRLSDKGVDTAAAIGGAVATVQQKVITPAKAAVSGIKVPAGMAALAAKVSGPILALQAANANGERAAAEITARGKEVKSPLAQSQTVAAAR